MEVKIIQVKSPGKLPQGILLEEVRFFKEGLHCVFPWGKVIDGKLYKVDKRTEKEIGLNLGEISKVSYIVRE